MQLTCLTVTEVKTDFLWRTTRLLSYPAGRGKLHSRNLPPWLTLTVLCVVHSDPSKLGCHWPMGERLGSRDRQVAAWPIRSRVSHRWRARWTSSCHWGRPLSDRFWQKVPIPSGILPTGLLSDCRPDCNLRVGILITSIYNQIADIDKFIRIHWLWLTLLYYHLLDPIGSLDILGILCMFVCLYVWLIFQIQNPTSQVSHINQD